MAILSFTFLATLVLLLGVSAGIITRSFLLRRAVRRHFQAMSEAYERRPGEPGRPRRKKKYGTKPKLWEASIAPSTLVHVGAPCSWRDIAVSMAPVGFERADV
jgi:hypothetical protein